MFLSIELSVRVTLENGNGKLFVYASCFVSRERRFEPVRAATKKMARYLNLTFEIKTFRKRFEPIYVYYKNGDDEPIPICCVNDKFTDIEEICSSLRNMMFVLSFHPRHSALKQMRKEIMQFS
jgi:hypothetical protein